MRLSSQSKTARRSPTLRHAALLLAAASIAVAAAGCDRMVMTRNHGYILAPEALDQVPAGSSKEQVDFVLGTPSTTADFGGEVYYYISQRTETIAFLAPEIVEQRVLAVYFDNDGLVERVAHYGVEDGRVVDFINRTTPTTGEEVSFLRQVFSSATGVVYD